MIIDFHTHVFPDKIASDTVRALEKSGGVRSHSDGTANGLLSALELAKADVAVNLPVLTKHTQFESVLGFAKSLNEREYSKERIISFAGIHPDDPDVYEHLHAVSLCGIKGVKIHPDYQNVFFDDERYVRIISIAKELGLIVVTHAGVDTAFRSEEAKCTPLRVLRLLDRVGGYSKLVLAHLGGSELCREVIDRLAGEDVYFDTAFNLSEPTKEEFFELLSKHGAEKILFATDSPWRSIASELLILQSFGLSESESEKLLSGNAKRLLEI